MAEYIEREALLKAIDAERDELAYLYMFDAEHIVVHHARRIVEEATAADVAPVVRCKDCLYAEKEGFALYCHHWGCSTDDYGYCHYGDRRTDDGQE